MEETNNQTAKADNGKPRLTLVPRQIIFDIAKVREYGNEKYGDPDNWKTVEKERYRNAAYRHFMAYLDNPHGVDEESGLPHLSHLACNIAFLCELEKRARTIDAAGILTNSMSDDPFKNICDWINEKDLAAAKKETPDVNIVYKGEEEKLETNN